MTVEAPSLLPGAVRVPARAGRATTTASGSRPTSRATSPRSKSPRWRSSRTSACACPRSAATSWPTHARTGGSLFRIYRDVRFSKDKSPYKTHVGIQFRHAQARDVHAPGFYLHLEPGSVFMACGTWHPDRDTLHAIRTAIAVAPEPLADGRRRPGLPAALPARRRGAQAPAGRLRPRSPADRRTQAQGLHRHRRPDRVRRHRRRLSRPVPRPLRRGRRLHALPVRERTRAVLIRLHCK